ncbi:MAG TPA: D-alanine--D-alanine ligase, partial [Burkholderiales bacterium]|nr:D-alanine--D-alanine ligase [Burkholderiales bacterium]
MNFGKVAVLLGGKSAEREVSLKSGGMVLAALRKKGVDAHPFDPKEKDLLELVKERFQRVFIALHGGFGEDGTVQGVLEWLGIPYTGSGVLASALAMDKVMAKTVLAASGLDVPKGAVDRTANGADLDAARGVGLPAFVKPVASGSSVG